MRARPTGRKYWLQELLFDSKRSLSPIRVLHAGGGSGLADGEWWTHFRRDALVVECFEPNRREAEKVEQLAREQGYRVICHPIALSGKSGERKLYTAAHSGASSLFPPNRRLVERLAYSAGQQLGELHKVVEVQSVATCSLDDLRRVGEVSQCDFMKLNIQGAELEVLKGGQSLLPGVLGLQVEASFYQVYDEAPYFADIDVFLRQQG